MSRITVQKRSSSIALVALALIGCAYAPPSANARTSFDPSAARRAFAAVVEHFRDDAEGELRVDPRLLRHDADFVGVDPSDLASANDSTLRARSAQLRSLGVPSTDIFEEKRCLFSTGMSHPPPEPGTSIPVQPDSTLERIRQCRARGPFTAIIASEPIPAGPVDGQPTWSVTVVRINSWSYLVYELRLQHDGQGRFEVIGRTKKFGVAS